MGRRSKARALNVWMNGELVGTWRVRPGNLDEFIYDKVWLGRSDTRPVSLSIPLSKYPIKGDVVRYYFDNLLPENDRLRQRIQTQFGTPSLDPFDLLAEIGRDCVGAIQLLPENAEPPNVRVIEGEVLSDDEIEQLLRGVSRSPYRFEPDEDFRISLAGVQDKTALLFHEGRWKMPEGATPTTHILKLPIGEGIQGIDLSTSVENEWLCEQILRAYAISTSNSRIINFGSQRVLAVERFDRRLSSDGSWIIRLPQEDFCQVMGKPAGHKYEAHGGPGIREIMDMLGRSTNAEEDRRSFFRTQIIFWMLAAIDGHAKNFSIFLMPLGNFALTPRYDVLSAYPMLGKSAGKLSPNKIKMAMAFDGKNRHYEWAEIQPRHIIQTGIDNGIPDAADLLHEIASDTQRAINEVSSLIEPDFPQEIADTILGGLDQMASKVLRAG